MKGYIYFLLWKQKEKVVEKKEVILLADVVYGFGYTQSMTNVP